MSFIIEQIEQNIIAVRDDEIAFFEEFTREKRIPWSYEEKKNGILPLSKSYVGYITTPNRIIALNPKYNEIGFEHIIRMYLYVYGYRPNDSAAILDVSNAEANADVADLFIRNLSKNMREGIIRTYKRTNVIERVLKGRVDYTKTYINIIKNKRKYVDTNVSSLSLDNDINNLILTALAKLKHVRKYTAIASELAMYFDGAQSNVENGSVILERINFNSNTARYRRTLTYAAMIIDQLSYSDKGSSVGTDSFLLNFDKLFEDFVAKILKEVPEKKEFSTWSTKRQFATVINSSRVDEAREYQPDILFQFKSEDEHYDYQPSAYAVLDVKNKAYGEFKNADIYQMLTYTKLLHGKKSLLLYPSFYRKKTDRLELDPTIFEPSCIYSCYVNIADSNGDDFLKSIAYFAKTVLNTIWGITV